MNRRWLLPGVALLAVALIGGGVAYSESKSSDEAAAKSKITKLEDAFFARLAKQLGVSEAKLRDALKTAGGATIDDAVKQGLLTKEQADFLKGRLSSEGFDFDLDLGRFKHHGFGHGFEKRFKHGHAGLFELMSNPHARTAIADAIARKLGTTRTALERSLGEGKDLEDLAAAKHVSEEALGAVVAKAAKPFVDALVKAGKLDRAEADALLERLSHGAWIGKLAGRTFDEDD